MSRRVIKGLVIRPDKSVELVDLDHLAQYQEAVGGFIEPVRLSDGATMYVNEEFRYKFGPDDFNSVASDVAGLGGRPDLMLSGILGPVVIVGPLTRDGYDTDITETARQWVYRVLTEALAAADVELNMLAAYARKRENPDDYWVGKPDDIEFQPEVEA